MKKIVMAAAIVALGCLPAMAQDQSAPTPTDPHAWSKEQVLKTETTTSTTTNSNDMRPAQDQVAPSTDVSKQINPAIESIDSNYPKEVQELQDRKENNQMMTAITSPVGLASIAGLIALIGFMMWKSSKNKKAISAD